MKLRILIWVTVLSLLVAVLVVRNIADHSKSKEFGSHENNLADSISYPIAAILDTPIENNSTIVYTAAFQMAWNELTEKVLNGPVNYNTPNPIADILNQKQLTQADLPPESCIAVANRSDRVAQRKFKQRLDEFFPENQLKLPAASPGLGTYAFLKYAVDFPQSFDPFHDDCLLFPDHEGYARLRCFGIENISEEDAKEKDWIRIHDYQNFKNFIVSFETKEKEDEFVCAVIPQPKTLLEGFRQINKRIRDSNAQRMCEGESIRMPNVNLDMRCEYNGPLTQNATNLAQPRMLHQAFFKLNRHGAKFTAFADITDYNGAEPTERDLLFNKPFLMYLKRKSANLPYFVAWIGTPEFLEKFD